MNLPSVQRRISRPDTGKGGSREEWFIPSRWALFSGDLANSAALRTWYQDRDDPTKPPQASLIPHSKNQVVLIGMTPHHIIMPVERIGYGETDLDMIKRGASQARQSNVNVGVNDLVISIKTQGLMEPVHLVEIEKDKIYELIDGQRRYQAFLILAEEVPAKFSKIPSFVYKNTMEPWEKKTFSLHANLSQAPMNKIDTINAVTVVYKHFGSIKKTVEATGFSDPTVRRYVRLARLPEPLVALIEDKTIRLNTALSVADLYKYDPNSDTQVDVDEMIEAAKEMQNFTEKHKKYIEEIKQQYPERKILSIITDTKSKKRSKHEITIEVETDTYEGIDSYKDKESIETIPLAAVELLRAGLDAQET